MKLSVSFPGEKFLGHETSSEYTFMMIIFIRKKIKSEAHFNLASVQVTLDPENPDEF